MRRFALPLLHCLVDCALLGAFVWEGQLQWESEKASDLKKVAFQEAAAGQFDLSGESPTPGLFILLSSGTLPAGIISSVVRSHASWQSRDQFWDRVWLCIHEAIAIPVWLLLGGWASRKLMRRYLIARAVLAGLAIMWGGGQYWTILQVGFWIWLGLAGCLWGARRLTQFFKLAN